MVPGVGSVGLAGAQVGRRLLIAGWDATCNSDPRIGCTQIPNRNVAVYDATSQQWRTSQSLSETRVGMIAVATSARVLFAGGATGGVPSQTVDVFDATTGTWTTTRSPHRNMQSGIAAGDEVVFVAGQPLAIDVYGTRTHTWRTRTVPNPHTAPVLAVNGRQVLLIGNGGASAAASDAVDIYDLDADVWSSANLSVPRLAPVASTLGSQTFIAGGLLARESGQPLTAASDVVDVLDFSESQD